MKKDKLISELIEKTIYQLKKKGIGSNGIIRKIYLINEKKWLELYKPDDYGDYIPFISVGENSTDFAKEQLKKWKTNTLEGVPLAKHKIPLPQFPALIYLDDYLDGLAVMYHTFRDIMFLEEGITMCNKIDKLFSNNNGFFNSVILPFIHLPLPEGFLPTRPSLKNLRFVNSSSNGLICEKMLDFGIWTENNNLIIRARRCIDAFLSTKTYKSHSLFPSMTGFFDSENIIIAKHNTNLAYAMLKSAKIHGGEEHKKQLKKLINTIYKLLYKKGGIINRYVPKKRTFGETSFVSTNAFCRLLIESSVFLKEKKYWEIAESIVFKIAEQAFILKKPNFWKEQMYEDDGVGDFANLVMVLDQNRKRIKLLKIIFKEMENKFYIGDGLWRDYSKESMQQTAHSKYLGGVLKYLVLYRAYMENKDLLSEKWMYLSQDR